MKKREAALEAALLEYVEKYGLTEKARAAFGVMGKQSADDGTGRAGAECSATIWVRTDCRIQIVALQILHKGSAFFAAPAVKP